MSRHILQTLGLVASLLPYGCNISDAIVNAMLIYFLNNYFWHLGCSSAMCQACTKHQGSSKTNKTGKFPSNRVHYVRADRNRGCTEREPRKRHIFCMPHSSSVNSWELYKACTHARLHTQAHVCTHIVYDHLRTDRNTLHAILPQRICPCGGGRSFFVKEMTCGLDLGEG